MKIRWTVNAEHLNRAVGHEDTLDTMQQSVMQVYVDAGMAELIEAPEAGEQDPQPPTFGATLTDDPADTDTKAVTEPEENRAITSDATEKRGRGKGK